MTYEVEINENSEMGKKIFSFLNDLGVPFKPKTGILEEQKYLLNESLNEFAESKVKPQEEVIAKFKEWQKSK
jgi:hypothetical protein